MWVELNGKRWRVRDFVGGHKVTIAEGYPTKSSAKAAAALLRADMMRGDALVPRGGQVTLTGWLAEWWPPYSATLKPSTKISTDGILRRYIRPPLGGYALEDLTPLVIQQWTADLLAGTHSRQPLSPKTIRNAHGVLHKALSEAVNQRLIRSNPAARTGMPRRTHHEMRFLTEPEAERLIATVGAHWRPLVMLILATGLRWGEAIGLRVRDVDVLAHTLTVRTTTQELACAGLDLVDVEPKPGRSRRSIGYPVAIAEILIPLVAGRGREDRVFTAPEGGPVRTRNFGRLWRKWRAAADLDGLRVHDLRHTHAAWLISAGVPLTAVQRRLGHSSITVTSDLYGHLMPSVDAAIVAILDAALPKINIRGIVGETVGHQMTPDGTECREVARQHG